MIKSLFIWISITLLSFLTSQAQQVIKATVQVSYNKTLSIVFPYSIRSVDLGNGDIVAQKARGVENVLQVKAGIKDFTPTNITVITADGTLYHFDVTYNEAPGECIIPVSLKSVIQPLILQDGKQNERDIFSASIRAIEDKVIGKVRTHRKYSTKLCLQEIFIRDDIFYFRLTMTNRSTVSYDVKSLKFFIRDKKQRKRTSSQEIEVLPIHVQDPLEKAYAASITRAVYAIPKFTIPDGKNLHINLFEENGGRHLRLKVKNKDLLRAEPLPVTNQLFTTTKQ